VWAIAIPSPQRGLPYVMMKGMVLDTYTLDVGGHRVQTEI